MNFTPAFAIIFPYPLWCLPFMSALSLQVLGTFQAALDDHPLTAFESNKGRVLLVYLAMSPGQAFSRDFLADLLWPNLPADKARHNLRQTLSNLRRLLHDRQRDPPFLATSRAAVQFNPGPHFYLDAARFRQALAWIESLPPQQLDQQPECIDRLVEALELYRGDFLTGLTIDSLPFEEWATIQRERLHRLAMDALRLLANYYERHRDYARARHYARRQVELEPWREEAHRQLMRLLARTGQRTAALQQYQHCRRILETELGLNPAPETVALYERIRSLPETHRHNLPSHPTPFIGRRRELEELTRLARHPDCRLLTLVGLGGAGKTRLALEAARHLQADFFDGVYFVPLESATDTVGLVSAIAAATGLTFHDRGHPQEQLLNFLQKRECLLILDNFEHLPEAASFVGDILFRAGQVKIWVTSRQRLNLPWERPFEVAGLASPGDEADDATRFDAGQLYLSRARQIHPGFRLTPADRLWLNRLCRLLDGLPLGLELAAGWTRLLSVKEIYARLSTALDTTLPTRPHLPDRQRSLEVVLRHSWDMLTPEEQAVFCRLALFRGGFDRTAAEQVAGATPAILTTLLDRSLIRQPDGRRFDLHPLWRQFLLEQLAHQPEEMARSRHAHSRYFLNLLTHPPDDRPLDVELENLWAGWKWAVDQASTEQVAAYVDGLTRFLGARHRFREIVTLLEYTLDTLPPENIAPAQKAIYLRRLGEATFNSGDLQKSGQSLREALALLGQPMPEVGLKLGVSFAGQLARQIWRRLKPDRPRPPAAGPTDRNLEAAAAYERLGEIYFFANRSQEAAYAALRGLNLAEAAPDSELLARLYAGMGVGMGLIPIHRLARLYLDLGLSEARRLSQPAVLGRVLELAALYYSGVGQWSQAERMARQGVELNRQAGDLRRSEECLVILAQNAHFLGEFQHSSSLWHRVYELALQRGDVQVQRWALTGQAENMVSEGRYSEAIDLLELVLILPLEISDHANDISAAGLLAAAYLGRQESDTAAEWAGKALRLIQQTQPAAYSSLEGYAATTAVFTRLWAQTGSAHHRTAARQAVKAMRSFARVFPIAEPRAWLWQAVCCELDGQTRRARTCRAKARAAAARLKTPVELKILDTQTEEVL